MFGGFGGGRYHNDTYLLDMETWVRVYTHTCNRHNTVVLLVLVHQQILYSVHVQSCVYIYQHLTCMYIIHIILIVTCHATYNYSCNVYTWVLSSCIYTGCIRDAFPLYCIVIVWALPSELPQWLSGRALCL